jgi:hypothetical protein
MKWIKTRTAIPEEPFNNRDGTRVGSKDGSFCELSKLGTKSTCKITKSSTDEEKGTLHNNHSKRKGSKK